MRPTTADLNFEQAEATRLTTAHQTTATMNRMMITNTTFTQTQITWMTTTITTVTIRVKRNSNRAISTKTTVTQGQAEQQQGYFNKDNTTKAAVIVGVAAVVGAGLWFAAP